MINWKHFVSELGKHGPDGLVVIALFALLIMGLKVDVPPWPLVFGLTVVCILYLLLRWRSDEHQFRLAALPIEMEEARLKAVKGAHRPAGYAEQPQLPLTARPRRLTNRKGKGD